MKQTTKTIICALTFLVLTLNFISALNVDSEYITIYSGQEGSVTLEVGNNLNDDLNDVSVRLNLEGLPFTSVGSSEKIEDIDEDDEEKFTFKLKASTDIVPGDYNIPYVISYEYDSEDITETGSFGLRVSAKTELDFSVESKGASIETPIVGSQGQISFKIINQGLGEVKFVSVQVFPSGYELISSDKIYIGNIDSDDSDFATFDVIFKNKNPTLSVKVNYKDFDNKDQVETITLPVKVYTMEEALSLGLIQKNRSGLYVGGVIVIVVIWFIWRKVKKARKKNKVRNGGI